RPGPSGPRGGDARLPGRRGDALPDRRGGRAAGPDARRRRHAAPAPCHPPRARAGAHPARVARAGGARGGGLLGPGERPLPRPLRGGPGGRPRAVRRRHPRGGLRVHRPGPRDVSHGEGAGGHLRHPRLRGRARRPPPPDRGRVRREESAPEPGRLHRLLAGPLASRPPRVHAPAHPHRGGRARPPLAPRGAGSVDGAPLRAPPAPGERAARSPHPRRDRAPQPDAGPRRPRGRLQPHPRRRRVPPGPRRSGGDSRPPRPDRPRSAGASGAPGDVRVRTGRGRDAASRRRGPRVAMFGKILIANRGEIALRILRTCRELGIRTVVAHSNVDADSLPVRLADESVCFGPADSVQSYLNIPRLIAAAEITDADAIHPGYGFLAESPTFAEICRASAIRFIGPSAEVIRLLGDKVRARELARKSDVPLLPGSDVALREEADARSSAEELVYPVLLKAALGGGGRG